MTLSDRAYKWLVNIATYIVPAVSTAYFGLAAIWGLPYGEQIVGTLAVLDTFLAVLIKIAQTSYDNESTETETESEE